MAVAPPPRSLLQRSLPALALVALGVLAYLPGIMWGGFIWDDDTALTQNAVMAAPDGLQRIWGSFAMPDYYPLMWSLLWLEWRWFGMHPAGYHAVSLACHLVGALLAWQVLQRLRVPGAWLAALIFAVHPVTVASVTWVSEIKNTMSLAFYALATWLWLEHEDRDPRAPHLYALSLLAFAAALLCKTSGLLLPLAFVVFAWWQRGRVTKGDLARTVPFLALSVLAAAGSIFTQHRMVVTEVIRPEGFASRLAASGWAFWFYLGKVLVPWPLSMVYPRWDVRPESPTAWLPLLFLMGALLAAAWKRDGWGRPVLVAMAWMILMLLPVAGFVDIYFMRYSLVADHWQYLSMIGAVALLVGGAGKWVAARGEGARRAATVGAAVAVVVLGCVTWRQASIYATREALWRHTVSVNPTAFVAHYNLGVVLEERGDLRAARQAFEEAVRRNPAYGPPYIHLGALARMDGDTAGAVDWYRSGLRAEPWRPELHYNLGVALFKMGRLEEAAASFGEATRLRPSDPAAWSNLGSALEQAGREREALDAYGRALALDGSLSPVLQRVAWVQATARDASVRDPGAALKKATDLCERGGATDPGCLDLLAAAQAASGQYREAVETVRRALGLAEAAGNAEVVATLRRHLGCYETMQPCPPSGR